MKCHGVNLWPLATYAVTRHTSGFQLLRHGHPLVITKLLGVLTTRELNTKTGRKKVSKEVEGGRQAVEVVSSWDLD